MSKELRTPADAPEVAPLVEARIIESQELTQERNASVKALATQLHYDGSLSVGALEDEIRFYQRRTVEACLELGKRLLLLKEITPHGEFTQRAELLGFSDRTARRFMQAAAKTAKSANLAVLSTQVKSASAFLELVTEDDDTLKAVSEMDEVDRMSATELRAAVRMARQHADDAEQQVARKDAKINELDRKLNGRKVVGFPDWPDEFKGYIEQAQKAKREILNAIDTLAVIRQDAVQIEARAEGEAEVLGRAWVALADEMQTIFAITGGKLESEGLAFDNTLQALADEHREGSSK